MKKVLGVLLAMALTVGAFAGLTILSASAQAALVEGQSLTEDFEGNTNTYFSAQGIAGNGTSEVVNTQKHDGEYALKFSGGINAWDMPGLNGDAVRKVVNGQAGNYRFHAWVYFETMPSDDTTGLSLLFRGTQDVIITGNNNIPFGTSNEGDGTRATIEQGKWIEVTYTCALTETQAKDSALSISFDSMGKESVFYIDDVTFEKIAEEVAVKEVVNGDAENGTTGWSTFMGGSVEQVSGGANGTANAIKFTPDGEKNEYQTIAFDFGPAIIQDEAKGYAGAGAGEYTISFWAKTDSPKPENTKFKVVLNSKKHVDAKDGQISGIEGDGYVNSYITTSTVVELTDQWQKFEANVTISEAYLKTIKALYDAGNTNAYELILRLDGAGANYAFGTTGALTLFPYYVDEAAIAVAGGEQPGGGDEEVTEVQGVTVKVTSADEGAAVYVKFDKFAGHLKNGKMTVKIHNTGTSEIKLILEARLNDSKWTTVKAGEAVTIAAGKVATLTIDCPDKMTSLVDSKEYVPFMLLKIEGAKAGDQFTVYGFTRETMETQKPVSTITTGKASLEYGTTTKACPTGDAAPVAILAIAAAACVMLGLVVAVKKKKETVG